MNPFKPKPKKKPTLATRSKEGDLERAVDRSTKIVVRAGMEYFNDYDFAKSDLTLTLFSSGGAGLYGPGRERTNLSAETMDALVRLWPVILTERARIASLKDTP